MTNPHIDESGNKFWYFNGKNHRVDGPAIIWYDGEYWWYINGKRYLNNKSFQEAASLSDEDMTAIILKYGNIEL
jgi:hypothetical protein